MSLDRERFDFDRIYQAGFFPDRFEKTHEQRVRAVRARQELRMELRTKHEGMIGDLSDTARVLLTLSV